MRRSGELIRKEEVQRICVERREARTRWQQLSDGESLTLYWGLETQVKVR